MEKYELDITYVNISAGTYYFRIPATGATTGIIHAHWEERSLKIY